MDAILERIEKINPKINAYCTVSTEEEGVAGDISTL